MESMSEAMPVMLPAGMPVFMPAVQEEEKTEEIATPVIQDEPKTKTESVCKILMDGSVFKEIFGSVMALTPECRLNIYPDHISVCCVNNANVSMVSLDYQHGIFESYKGPAEKIQIGIDVSAIYSLRTMVKKGSLVLMDFICKTEPAKRGEDGKIIDEKKEYSYSVSIEGTTTDSRALDVNTIRREPHPPAIELKTSIDLKSEYFIQGIKDGSKISDKVALVFNQDTFSMVFDGDTRKMDKIVSILSSHTTDTGNKSRSLFSIDYLKDIVKTLDKKEVITLKIGTDVPMSLIRRNEHREIIYLLAPRVEAN